MAVGGSRRTGPRAMPLDPAAWLSADGVTWERVTSPSFSGEAARTYPGGLPSMATSTSAMWSPDPPASVAVGLDQLINTEGPAGETERPGIWWSADGRTWENVSRPETVMAACSPTPSPRGEWCCLETGTSPLAVLTHGYRMTVVRGSVTRSEANRRRESAS